jgi:hypothetical protein
MLQIPKKYFFEENGFFLNDEGISYFRKILKEELEQLYLKDNALFKKRASEDTLKLAFTLRMITRINHDSSLVGDCVDYYIDQNYNRLLTGMKYVEGEVYNYPDNYKPSRRLFDLVIHRRGELNGYPENLIHFEFKGTGQISKRFIDNDIYRLEKTTQNRLDNRISLRGYFSDGTFNYIRGYQLGIFIKFTRDIRGGIMIAFENGQALNNFEIGRILS